jgi:hypothetical protein
MKMLKPGLFEVENRTTRLKIGAGYVIYYSMDADALPGPFPNAFSPNELDF